MIPKIKETGSSNYITCETKKAKNNFYFTKKEACKKLRELHNMGGSWLEISAYKCGVCNCFHLGRSAFRGTFHMDI